MKQTTIRLPNELMEQLQREAERRGQPMKDLLMFILWEFVQSSCEPDSLSKTVST